MGALVIVLLAGLWASILLPGALRSRRDASPLDSVTAFERSMSRLAPLRPPPAGREILVLDRPTAVTGRPGPAPVVARRRANVARLAALVAATGVVALLVGGVATWVAAGAGAVFVGYLVILRRQAARAAQARRKIRHLQRREAERTASVANEAAPTGRSA